MWFPHSRLQAREMLLVGGPAILLVAASFWLAYQFVEPAPPDLPRWPGRWSMP
jgi:hypothetical protein